MAIAVNFYTFNKKANSTKIPTTVNATYNCNLIEPCSIINPVIAIVGTDNTFNPSAYNYVRIATFNRYYFVNDWVYDSGRWVAKCNVDVLASWKNNIGASEQYILRSNTNFNTDINDTYFPSTEQQTVAQTFFQGGVAPSGFPKNFNMGAYVVRCIGALAQDEDRNACNTYILTPEQFKTFCARLFDGDFWSRVSQGVFDFSTYLIKIFWIPFRPESFGAVGELRQTIVLGTFPIVDSPAYLVKNNNVRYAYSIDFSYTPKHPQASTYGFYLNCSPWTKHFLYYPPIGKIELDSWNLANGFVTLGLSFDLRTGLCAYTVSANENVLAVGTSDFSVDIPVSALSTDFKALSGAISSAIATTSPNPVKSTMALVDATMGIVDSFTPNVKCSGSLGAITPFVVYPVIISTYSHTVEHDNDHGKPCCKNLTISTLTNGFVQVQDPHFEIPCTDSEMEQINSFVTGGFFYE